MVLLSHKNPNNSLMMAIESSCDETAIAIIDANKHIYANHIFSQTDLHQLYGGVVPEIAARSHLEIIHQLTAHTLAESNLSLQDIDTIAVTAGPGLVGGLMVGVNFAQTLAKILQIPCYGINHLEGHVLSVRLEHDIAFPYLVLLTSGGHCQILAVRGVGDYHLYGTTLDDAAGETFDKIAHLLGLSYPGGPAIEKEAKNAKNLIDLPRPLTDKANCDFSFSGLKSAIRRKILQADTLDVQQVCDISASLQQAVVDIFKHKLNHAIARFHDDFLEQKDSIKIPIALVGGVASNQFIRQNLHDFCAENNAELYCPSPKICTDNAAMIAWAALEQKMAGHTASTITIRPRWSIHQSQENLADVKHQKNHGVKHYA